MSCPIIEDRSSKEWKDIEGKYGTYAVYEAWSKNNYSIPTLEYYENKIRPQKTRVEDEEYEDENFDTTRETYEESLKIVSELIRVQENLKILPDGDGIERYYHEVLQKFISKRVTDLQKALYLKGKTKKELKKMEENENSPWNEQLKRGGTFLHDTKEKIVNAVIKGEEPMRPELIPEVFFERMVDQVKDIVEDARSLQAIINPEHQPIFLTETTLFDESDDMAGTIDLLVVFSDKSAAVYDWKFRSFKPNEDGLISPNVWVEMKKEFSWDSQLSHYAKMLTKYGIKKIRRSRIIPIHVSYESLQDDTIIALVTPESKMDENIKIISVAREYIEDEGLYKTISSLLERKKKFLTKIESGKHTEKDLIGLDKVNKAIHALLIEGELASYINFVDSMVSGRIGKISVYDELDENYIPNDILIENFSILNLFKENMNYIYAKLKKEEEEMTPEDIINLKIKVGNVSGKLSFMTIEIEQVLKERAKIQGDKNGIKGINKEQKEFGFMNKYLTYLSEIDHPVFKLFSKYNQNSLDNTRDEHKDFNSKIDKEQDKVKKWAKSNGKSLQDAFDIMVDNETGNLHSQFRKELWEKRDEAIEEEDIAWLKENFEITDENILKLSEARDKYEVKMRKYYTTEKEIEDRMRWWDHKHNAYEKSSAWLNPSNHFLTVKETTKWSNPKWDYVQSQEPLKSFFTFHEESMKFFNDILHAEGRWIRKNFIPNVQKDIIMKIFSTGATSITDTMLNALEVKEDDETFGNTDKNTGERIDSIPILYLNPIRDRDGEISLTQKSYDLGRNLSLFSVVAFNYKNVSAMQDNVTLLQHLMGNREQLITDWWGNVQYEDPGKTRAVKRKGTDVAALSFDRFVEKYVYGRSLSGQEKDAQVKIGKNKIISQSSLVGTAMFWHSTKTLAFNFLSVAGAFGGTLGNTFVTSVKNIHYTAKGLALAHADLVDFGKGNNREKLVGVWDLLDISQEDLKYRKANDLSSKGITKYLTVDNAFILQRGVDNYADRVTLGAMMRNYGFATDGSIKRLSRLPEGSKTVWESIKIEGDQLSIITPSGDVLSKKESRKFRLKVRKIGSHNKGNMSQEDIMLAQTHLLGKALGQFRGWIPAMAKERFRDTRYDETMEEVQLGRYRVFAGELIKSGFLPTLKELLKIIGEFTMIIKPDGTMDTEASNFYYQKFLAENPDSEVTKEDFLEQRKGQLRAFMAEVLVWAVLLPVLIAGLSLAGEDDDDSVRGFTLKKLAKAANRTSMEMGFFFNPAEFKQLIQTPVPLVSLLTDITDAAVDVLTLDSNAPSSVTNLIPIVKGLKSTLKN